ncbi:heme exporter protein CcmD [Rhizobiaceae bacterium BDR2-2]|uniref:Heme exporter protein D n=1 Tax=Ectorhizobium quercum TaxID=2965071 RepID=A0AAE3N1N1_9HYPH|nr:heme exporter protein CcmD [Ectorhizobium quercum]MCX8999318.1 heme exporter protein CcmD [Ectorhizobium quercum]
MSHTFYIAASYAVTGFVVAVLCLWVWLDGRGRQRDLAELEAAGHRRRSAARAAAGEAA